MKKWDKLDREFYEVVDNLSDEEWTNWYNNQKSNSSVRKALMDEGMRKRVAEINKSKIVENNFPKT